MSLDGMRAAATAAPAIEPTTEELAAWERAHAHRAEENGRPIDRAAARRAGEELRRVEAATVSPFAKVWRSLDLERLRAPQPPRTWLLRHPTVDGKPCPRFAGDGLFPLGKVGLFLGEGGSGKTNVVFDAAIAIVTRRPWLGHFHVDPRVNGRVCIGVAEEDEEEVYRRLHNLGEAMELTDEEWQLVARRVIVLPLAGHDVALLRYASDGRTLVATGLITELRARLLAEAGDVGWSLINLDPVARFAPDAEGSNPAATQFVQMCESLVTLPGTPSVLGTHHSSKNARGDGGVDSRGVTALTDAARWVAKLRLKGTDAFFTQSKSNYSRPMFDELRLVRGPHGMFRAATESEELERRGTDETKAKSKADARGKRVEALKASIVAALRTAAAPVTSRDQALAGVNGDTHEKREAWYALTNKGTVRKGPSKSYEVACAG